MGRDKETKENIVLIVGRLHEGRFEVLRKHDDANGCVLTGSLIVSWNAALRYKG